MDGRTTLENAQADEVVDAVSDLVNAMVKVFFAKDEEGIKTVVETTWPAGLVNK